MESVAEPTQKDVSEEAGEKDVDDESPGHRDVGRHDHPQQERRIKNVAVHGGDVRHPAEQIGIPEREMTSCAQSACAELAKGVTGDVLVAMGIDEEPASQRRIGERQSRKRV